MVNAATWRGAGFVAFRPERSYLSLQGDLTMTRMPAAASPPVPTGPLIVLGGVAGVLGVAAIGLWAWYGTTVFFEILRAGLAACF